MKPLVEKTSNAKQGKKKPLKKQTASMFVTQGDMSGSKEEGGGFLEVIRPSSTTKKVAKTRVVLKKEASAAAASHHSLFQQNPDKPISDTSLPDEYRILRHKFLLLEEESFNTGRELREVEDVVKTLEDEKLALLDELVVLEGLIDPSELQQPKV